MPIINCAEGGLVTYQPSTDMPWDRQRAVHLCRRMALGSDIDAILDALDRSPSDIVNQIIDNALDLPLADKPEWADWTIQDYSTNQQERNEQVSEQILSWSAQWLRDIQHNGIRDRMSFFWHNHFVTRLESYGCPSYMYRYHELLQRFALGNFREFVSEMGKTPAMLVFLNNIQNTRFNINENYARELYELFTLGVDNGYTQDDIQETARAITGWNGLDTDNYCSDVVFIPQFWDDGEKTIFGQTGPWGYDDVIRILFEERADEISEFICTKLYQHFVNPKIDEQIIADLAEIFRASDWEIAPVLRTLFSSEHFFDSANIGTIIPGHIEYLLGFLNEMKLPDQDDIYYFIIQLAGEFDQYIFNPTDVSGWPGNRIWISSASLNFRIEIIAQIMGYYYQLQDETLEPQRSLALSLVESRVGDHIYVTESIVDYFMPNGLQTQAAYEEAIEVFKAEVPENYFEDGSWNLFWDYAPAQVYFLISHLAQLPEFQLK